MRFSVVIATNARPALIREAASSAAEALPLDGEVIVVDGDSNRSAEGVARELADRFRARLRYIPSGGGTARQRNVGIDAASGEVVVLIDDDCTVEPGLFEALTSAYEDPGVVGATGRVKQPRRARVGNSRRFRWLVLGGGRPGTMTSYGHRRPILAVERPCDVEYMYGPLMTARREIAAQVGFDERLSGYSLCEDDDFSYRVSRVGRVRYIPDAVVHHREAGRRTADQRHLERLRVIDRAYMFHKNFRQTPSARMGFAALIAMLFAHRALNGEWSGVRGLLEGVRELRRSGAVPERPRAHNEPKAPS
jgi:GT2 family glycosyltransferase